MNLIKLDAINSTNEFLKDNIQKTLSKELQVVYTFNQTKGKGQRGNSWESQPEKNIAISLGLFPDNLKVENQFTLSMLFSLFILNTLKSLKIPDLKIKWPNDIMSRSKKMAGILIENQIKQGNVVSSVIGLGINVNEKKFKSLPQATSMLLATGNKFDLNEVLQLVIEEILIQLTKLDKGEYADLKIKYETSLFRKDMISVFEVKNGYRFNGKIKGVNEIGKIVIENENEILNSYQLKEIKMLF